MIPERFLPQPLPKVEPQWEYAAGDALREIYKDYKRRFQVPWVGVVSMAYARHQAFFECWWAGLRDVVDTELYVRTARALRERVETRVAELDPPPIAERLLAAGYTRRELGNIRDIIEFLSHGNFIQIPAVFAARALLEGCEFGDARAPAEKFADSHAVACETPFVLIEPHHALRDHQGVYQDVMQRLGLPFVNTDYRALARWPSYFAMAWGDLRDAVGGPAHEALAISMHEAIFKALADLPNPRGLTSKALCDAARQDGEFERIRDTVRLFIHLLPGLTVNVAFFRQQLL